MNSTYTPEGKVIRFKIYYKCNFRCNTVEPSRGHVVYIIIPIQYTLDPYNDLDASLLGVPRTTAV